MVAGEWIEVAIPNKELMLKYEEVLQKKELGYVSKLARQSQKMLKATLEQDTETMEQILSLAHDTEVPILNYNNETDLSALVNLVYLAARDQYRIQREERAGRGYADFIFYPKKISDTALVLELKVDASPQEALQQIKEKKYAMVLKSYFQSHGQHGKIFAVALTYYRKTKEHHCLVEEILD